MNRKISVCVICVEAIIYLILNNLHYCTFSVLQRSTVLDGWCTVADMKIF